MKNDFVEKSVMDMREYNPDYHADGTLVWKKIGGKTGRKGRRKKKVYPSISLDKIELNDTYEINEEILEASRKQYKESEEMIPVFLSYDLKLLQGYEQYLLAKELNMTKIPFQRKKMNSRERKEFTNKAMDRKFGNKKYPLTTVDGDREYITLSQIKKVRRCRRMCKKCGDLSLDYLGNLKFVVTNADGETVIGTKKGRTINSINKFFKSHLYEKGKFVKRKSENQKH